MERLSVALRPHAEVYRRQNLILHAQLTVSAHRSSCAREPARPLQLASSGVCPGQQPGKRHTAVTGGQTDTGTPVLLPQLVCTALLLAVLPAVKAPCAGLYHVLGMQVAHTLHGYAGSGPAARTAEHCRPCLLLLGDMRASPSKGELCRLCARTLACAAGGGRCCVAVALLSWAAAVAPSKWGAHQQVLVQLFYPTFAAWTFS